MKQLLALVLVATALALAPGASAASATLPAAAAAGGKDTVRLGGVAVKLRKGTRDVVTVNRTRGWHARVTFWRLRGGEWRKAFRARDGRVGYGGLVRARNRVQGSGKTPLGTFRLPFAFGMHRENDKWDDSYRRARRGTYWVLDNESDYYNRWRHRSRGGFRWRLGAGHPDASERLRDYPRQYEFAVATSFNRRQVKHRGGAIFFHVNGDGATAGCASAPKWFVRRLLYRLDQGRKPLIAIGR